MALNLANYETRAADAVRMFWNSRQEAKRKQAESGNVDQGERSGVTGGKNMDGFIGLIVDLVQENGLAHAEIHLQRSLLTLPGFFRPTKFWDLLVTHQGRLIAAFALPKTGTGAIIYLSRGDLLRQK